MHQDIQRHYYAIGDKVDVYVDSLMPYKVLPLFRICRIASFFLCLNESSVVHHQPKLQAKEVLDSHTSPRVRDERN
jgi:hypothetical protein